MSQATVTAKVGPAIQATSLVITDVTGITFDASREILTVFKGSINAFPYKEFELTGSNTITLTAAGGVYTLTVS